MLDLYGEQCADYRKLPYVLALRCIYPSDLKSASKQIVMHYGLGQELLPQQSAGKTLCAHLLVNRYGCIIHHVQE